MAIIRNRTQQQYTNVANSIFRNKELSLRDRGLLTTLLSLPDNWRFSVTGLAEILKKDGKHSISAGLASLEKQGYLVRRQVKSKDGKFCGYEWEIFEEPQMKVPITDFRETDNPLTEKLSAENQPQSNTNKVITKELNTNRSSEEEMYRNKWQYQSAVKQTSGKVAEIVFEELMKSSDKAKMTDKGFRDICKQIEGYGKPISNLRAFVKRCLENYFDGNVIRYQPKRNSFNDFPQREYDFEELEQMLLSN